MSCPSRTGRRLLTSVLLAPAILVAAALTAGPVGAVTPDPTPSSSAVSDTAQSDSAEQEVSVLTEDVTPEVSVDPGVFTAKQGARLAQGEAVDDLPSVSSASAALSLHSRLGSQRTIFIDFDGQTITNTAWNSASGLPNNYVAGAWSLDSDPTSFSSGELTRIQDIWSAVAEDYAPFDVDVTTEDPGEDALNRSSSADLVYGTRALVTSSEADDYICGGSCGGVAYIDVFNLASGHSVYQPAWIFPNNLSNNAKYIADAVSHEVGHNFGLEHDDTTSSAGGYYAGQGIWGPIMGAPYSRPITQWSKGEYANAGNTEDDLAIIAAGGAPYRADEAGGTLTAAATGLPAGTAVISSASDVDVWKLTSCTGAISVQADTALVSPNLDIKLVIRDASGTEVAAANPPSEQLSYKLATGMSATASVPDTNGTYYVSVDGVGAGNPAGTGYSDYGSVGAYTLALSGTCSTSSAVPSAPRSVRASTGAASSSVDVAWSAPASPGLGVVTGYRISASPGGTVITTGATTTQATFTDLTLASTYTFTVVATSTSGNGAAASTSFSTPADRPGTVTNLAANGTAGGAIVTWNPPTSDGGSAVTGYRFQAGSIDQVVAPNVSVVNLSGFGAGFYTFTVTAMNAAGSGSAISTGFTVPGASSTSAANTTGSTSALVASGAGLRLLAKPALTGATKVGSRLKVRSGRYSRSVQVRYQWKVGTKKIKGARGSSYRLTPAEAGRPITVQVIAVPSAGRSLKTTLKAGRVKRR